MVGASVVDVEVVVGASVVDVVVGASVVLTAIVVACVVVVGGSVDVVVVVVVFGCVVVVVENVVEEVRVFVSVKVSVEQFSTLVDPVEFVCRPFGHGVHHDEFVASAALEYVSSGHGVGADESKGQKFPAPHAIAGAEALGQYVPGRQA